MVRGNHVDIDSIGRSNFYKFEPDTFVHDRDVFIEKFQEEPTLESIKEYLKALQDSLELVRRQIDALAYRLKSRDISVRKSKEAETIRSAQSTINQIYNTIVGLEKGNYDPNIVVSKVTKLRTVYFHKVRESLQAGDKLVNLAGSMY